MAIEGRHFGDNFIYVAGLPKSASSLMWLIVSALQEESGRADPGKMPDLRPSPYQHLKSDLIDLFPKGGTFSGHAPLNFDSNRFLRAMRCKYVVHLRHPADFVVGLYCHLESNPFSFVEPRLFDAARFGGEEEENWVYALSPVRRVILLREKTSTDEALTSLLREGALFKAMEWMTDWLAYRDSLLSIVSTYEGLMNDFDAAINRLCHFVRGHEIDDGRLKYLRHVFLHTAEEGKKKDATRYPKGWTGAVGIWKSYFNKEHVAFYNDTVKKFLFCYPNAEALLSIYKDDLILPQAQ